MKKITLLLLYFFFAQLVLAQKGQTRTMIGFQTGIVAPFTINNYSIPKYKIGLPSFSYSASIEKRFTLNYKLSFSLQYSLSYFYLMQKNLEKAMIKNESKLNPEKENINHFASNMSFNTIYKVKNDFGIVGGVGVSKPMNFMDKSVCRKDNFYNNPECRMNNNKYIPALNPFLIIGIENSCTIFRKNLIYSIQYNIGFLPYRNMPLQNNTSPAETQYMHGVNIGLKYKY